MTRAAGSWRERFRARGDEAARDEVERLRSALERTTAQLAEREAELARARRLEAVGRLAGSVVHEFNNLLAVITGLADLALERVDNTSETHDDLTEIRAAAERAGQLTRQLLAFTREQALEPRPLALDALIRDLAALLQRLAGERIAVRLDLPGEAGCVRADAGQLEQALVDLVLLARDATLPDGGEIRVTTAREGRWALLRVIDHGAGRDEEARHVERPGLALAFVQAFARAAGGEFSLDTEPGKGTRAELRLPALTA